MRLVPRSGRSKVCTRLGDRSASPDVHFPFSFSPNRREHWNGVERNHEECALLQKLFDQYKWSWAWCGARMQCSNTYFHCAFSLRPPQIQRRTRFRSARLGKSFSEPDLSGNCPFRIIDSHRTVRNPLKLVTFRRVFVLGAFHASISRQFEEATARVHRCR